NIQKRQQLSNLIIHGAQCVKQWGRDYKVATKIKVWGNTTSAASSSPHPAARTIF
ncbi:hypothetical protein A2U01_0076944, partial [Trifolium medium]|nr:hypothetical protein [Trifolium medium]